MEDCVGEQRCKFCGADGGLSLIAVMGQDTEKDRFDMDEDRILWVCDDHYDRLIESDDHYVRELADPIEVDHSDREVEAGKVVILEPGNEEKWLQVPKRLEEDLSDIR